MKTLQRVLQTKPIADIVQLSLIFIDEGGDQIVKKIYIKKDEVSLVNDYIGKGYRQVTSKNALAYLFDPMRQLSIIVGEYLDNENQELYDLISDLSSLLVNIYTDHYHIHNRNKLKSYGYKTKLFFADEDAFSDYKYGIITRIEDNKQVKFKMI